MTLILNTWIFESDVQKGAKQADLVDRVAKLGANGIEVRREYFKDLDVELPDVAKHANEHNLIVNYSVPDVIFEPDGSVNPKLADYFEEGETMGISKIKFNTGNFDKFTGDLKTELGKFPIEKIEMNVENDQTPVSGTVNAIKTFLDAAYAAGLTQLGYVYDLGNWAFTHGDAIEAAKTLAPYTHYIHLKNAIDNNGKLTTSDDLDKGMFDWRQLLTLLPSNVQFALEYPMTSDAQISDQIKLFNKEVGE